MPKKKLPPKKVTKNNSKYPRPKNTGGTLIRQLIGFIRSYDIKLPLHADVFVACSGGMDSIALTHLLINYGRRVIPFANITILHINHGWRGKESDKDEAFVRKLAKLWGVPILVFNLEKFFPPPNGKSWEDHARKLRKKCFREAAFSKKNLTNSAPAWIFTAHHGDDLAETLLWRLFTGASQKLGGGIFFQHGVELRPFLKFRKSILKQYLKEECVTWREDSTNKDPKFLRASMRQKLIPVIEELFPKGIDYLIKLGIEAQKNVKTNSQAEDILFKNSIISAFEAIQEIAHKDK